MRNFDTHHRPTSSAMFGPPNDILSRRPMPSQVLPTSEPSTAPPKLTDSRHPQWYVRVAQDGSIPQPRPLPDHMKLETWNVPSPVSTILKLIFSTLCMISYGRNDLQNVWDAAVEDGEVWMARVDRMAMRLNAITFVVSRTHPQRLGAKRRVVLTSRM